MISRVPSHSRRSGLGGSPGFSKARVWMTWTVLSPEQATNRRPSGARAMSFGRTPTAISLTLWFFCVSTMVTLRLPQLLT